MGFMSRNLPAPRMMVSKMNQLRRTRYEEAMLNLQVSQQQKKPMMMMMMTTMNDSSADSPAMAIMDYSRVPAHLRHLPPRIVKRRLHLQQQSHGMLLHQNPCLEGADLRSSNAKPEHSDDEHKDMEELQTLVTYDETTSLTMSSTEEEMEQEQKRMEKKKMMMMMMMMIEELRYHEAAGTPPASLFYTEYLQFDGHTILPNEVVAILPATLDDEDKTLVAVLRYDSRKQLIHSHGFL